MSKSHIYKLLLIILSLTLIQLGVYGQFMGPTEDINAYGTPVMDGTTSGNTNSLESSDGKVITYDFNFVPIGTFDTNNFSSSLIPSINTSMNNLWPDTEGRRRVYQAHWITKLAIDLLEQDLTGINFGTVHVGSNFSGEQGVAAGNLTNGYIGLGTKVVPVTPANQSGLSTYSEFDVIGHELGHIILNTTSSISNFTLDVESQIIEGFCDIIGSYVESNLSPVVNDYDYVHGDKTPTRDVRDMSLEGVCWSLDVGQPHNGHLGHLFYLLTSGSLGIVPMNHLDVINLLFTSINQIPSQGTTRYEFRDLTLSEAELRYGLCSTEYRSIENAWKRILECTASNNPPPFFPVECCNAGDQTLNKNTTITDAFQFNGNLIVPSGITLTLDANSASDIFTFPPNTGLIVENGGELIINVAEINSCDASQKWNGIRLEDGSKFTCGIAKILNARKGIDIHNLADTHYSVSQGIDFWNCSSGIHLTNIVNNDYILNGQPYRFLNCTFGVSANNSNGTITNFDISSTDSFTDNYNGISLTDSPMRVNSNFIDCRQTGILLNYSDAEVGGTFSPNHIVAAEGISSIGSVVIIDNNIIEVTETGISHIISFETGSRISDNVITLHGNNNPDNLGIYAWLTDDAIIRNNLVQGSRHNASIFARNSQASVIEWNDTQATDSSNGIALEGGGGHIVQNNDIQENPNNSLGAWHTALNAFHDNDIAAQHVGLNIGRNLVDTLEVTCNRFCEGTFDLSLGSNIGAQDHHENKFRVSGSRARIVGLDPFNNENYRFGFEPNVDDLQHCELMNLFAVDDIDGIFENISGAANESCLDTSGTTLLGLSEEIFCEHLLQKDRLNAQLWYSQLKLLLGRYFATHGPQSLPDCIADCDPTILIRMEAKLREGTGQDGISENESETESNNLNAVALNQYNQLGGQGIVAYPDLKPCIDIEMVETITIHTETYKRLVKHLANIPLDQTDLSELASVASLCESEYGEAVSWAQGLLQVYNTTDYIVPDCYADLEARERTPVVTTIVQITITPQPADSYIAVQISEFNEIGSINVLDMAGRTLLSKDRVSNGQVKINTDSLDSGLYLLTLSNHKGVLITKRIVIQK